MIKSIALNIALVCSGIAFRFSCLTKLFAVLAIILFLSINTTHAQYCAAGSNNITYERIIQLQVGTINNTSTVVTGGYADYTGISTYMEIGTAYPITITNGITDASSQCQVWVDWNQNDLFTDAGETFTMTLSTNTFSGTITPPTGATRGPTTMRARVMYTGTLSSCGSTSYGEVEDYTIYVLPRIVTGTISPSAYCSGASISVPYTLDGPVLAANVFSAELSDASGSFASPTVIGTLTSTASGTISATLPTISSTATGYRIRVVSDSPAVNGADNGSDITINAIPSINGTTPSENCGTGVVLLGASASAGTINWYAAATGGSSLGSGTNYSTPSISTTTTYYVAATSNGCTSDPRIAVVATIKTIPTITGSTPNSNCGTGTVDLTAVASAGTINWYAGATGGSSLGPGGSFTTPTISTTTTYYVDATLDGCTSESRTAVVATIKPIPEITGTSPDSNCGAGIVMLGAAASAGTINWYASSTGGSILGTGTSFYTPSISSTTTYYVDATLNACTSNPRTAVIATIHEVPEITGTTPGSSCGPGTVDLAAAASLGTINWYAAATGGTLLVAGPNYTTPWLSNTTTYYVDAISNGCTTDSRTAIVALVAPSSVGGVASANQTICSGTSPADISLTASIGSIQWQSSNDNVIFNDIVGATSATLTAAQMGAITSLTYYRAQVTSGACSSANSNVVTISVISLGLGVSPPVEFCQYDIQMVESNVSGGSGNYTYSWEVVTSGAGDLFVTGATTNDFIWLTSYILSPDNYEYKLTVNDIDEGCQEVENYSVTITPNVNSSWVANPSSGCVGETGVSYEVETIVGTTYLWTVSGGSIASGQGSSQITVDWGLSSGSASVGVETTSGSCSQDLNQSVYLYDLPTISLGSMSSICSSLGAVDLPFTSTTGSPDEYSITFNAAALAEGFANVSNAALPSSPIVIQVPVNAAGGTSYNASLTVTNSYQGCESVVYPISITLDASYAVSVSIAASINEVCEGTSVSYTATPTNGGVAPTYQWKVNGLDVGTSNTVYAYNPSVGDKITCTLTSNYVCTTGNPATSNEIETTVHPASVGGTTSADQSINAGTAPSDISLSGYVGTIQWQWSSDNVLFYDISGASASPLTSAQMGTISATTYYRAVVTSGLCSSANSNTITVVALSDSDGDGVSNAVDLDDDNDGILDTDESNSLFFTNYDAYWPFENSLNDISGNNYNLAAGSATFSTASIRGVAAASFDGTSNYLQYSNGTFLNQAISYFTYSIWLKPSNLTGTKIILDEGGSTNGIAIRLNGNTLQNAIREGGSGSQVSTSSFTFPSDNNWHHVALTYDNGDMIMYFDGVASNTLQTGFGELAAHSSGHSFGSTNGGDAFGSSGTNYYSGLMDEAIHYPSVLTALEIDYLVNNMADFDNNGTANQLDLDSDGDGCFDANEAYGLSNADSNGDGTYGGVVGSAEVDATGKVIAASYATPVNLDSGTGITIPDYLQKSIALQGITTQPGDQLEAIPLSTIDFTVEAASSGTGTDIIYQWQENSGSGFGNISNGGIYSGANLATLTLTGITTAMHNYQYRVLLSTPSYVCDNDYTSNNATLTIKAVPLAFDDEETTNEDVVLNSTVAGNDIPSSDGGNVWSVLVDVTDGNLSFNTDGSFTYTPDPEFSGEDSFEYKIVDADGDPSSATVTITVLIDTDEDGIMDIADADDDNDGITDDLEMSCDPVSGFDGYWPVENSTDDASGNSHNLIGGTITYSTDCKKGISSASFNGTGDFLKYSDGTYLNQQISYFSYAFWVKPSTLSGIQDLLDEGGGTNGLAIRLNGNVLENSVREGGASSQLSTSSFTFPADDEWHHVAITYDNGTVIMYLDGVASTTLNTGFASLASHSSGQLFGGSDGDAFGASGNFYGGLMDDFVHYPSVISQSDVLDIMAGNCDTDNDLIVNRIDFDSDGDGCSDANEAYNNVDADGDDGDSYGTGVPAVDAEGKVIAASYAAPTTTAGGNYTYLEGVSINITTDPVDLEVCENQAINFTAVATASMLPTTPASTASTDLTYQWQFSTDGGANFNDVAGQGGTTTSGANVALYVASVPIAYDGTIIRVVFSNEACLCPSVSTALLTVNELAIGTFSYAGSPYCPNAANAFPTFSGGGEAGTFTSTPGLIFANPSTGEINITASTPGTYTVTNTIAPVAPCGEVVETSSITIINELTWTGAADTDWNNTGNWTCGIVPIISRDVQIADVTNQPILNNGAVGAVRHLTINSLATLAINDNTLQISGDISNSGTFTASSGTIEMKGAALQTIGADLFENNTIQHLTINNAAGVSLLGPLNVTGIVTSASGDFASDGNLTLVSSATKTALINGSGAGTVSGNVTMQRYLASGFGYKYFSSPFQAATVNQFADDMDLSAEFPSFYKYDESRTAAGWVSYVTASNVLNPMEGYAVNFGDVDVANTVDATGEVNNGALSISLFNNDNTYTKGFNLVGNPYPSPIDWDASSGWTKTNIDDALYYFNASGTDQYGGTYSTYINGISSDGVASNIIPSMQGFFVHVSNGVAPVSGTLGVDNNVRIQDQTQEFMKSEDEVTDFLLRLNAQFTDDPESVDPMVVYFNSNASDGIDNQYDALKLLNTDVKVPSLYATIKGGTKLSITALPGMDNTAVAIPLGLNISRDGELSFGINNIKNMPAVLRVYLYDAHTGINQSLLPDQEYKVQLKAGEHHNRFSLKLINNLVDNPEDLSSLFGVFSSDGIVKVTIKTLESNSGEISLFNLMGQQVYTTNVNEEGSFEFRPQLNTGVYIVSYFTGDKKESKRLFIQ